MLDCKNISIWKNTFSNNLAVDGGAIFLDRNQRFIIKDNYFQKNEGSNSGGGLLINILLNSTI